MAYRNKTYVCFDGDNDIQYYRLMCAWKASDNTSFNFHDAHDLNTSSDSSQEESIKRNLRVRFANSKLFIILVGQNTWRLIKFVKWEMQVALRLELPIIAVNLDGAKEKTDLCPPTIRDELVVFVPFKQKIIEHAMNHWPSDYDNLKGQGITGARHYGKEIYQTYGL